MFGKKKEESVITHDMPSHRESGYMYQPKEKLVVAVKAASPEGEGWLLETNQVVVFKHNTKGILLRVALKSIEEMTHKKGSIKIAWREGEKPYSFTVKLRQKIEGIDQWMVNMEKYVRSNATGYVVIEGDEGDRVKNARIKLLKGAIDQQKEQYSALKQQVKYLRNNDAQKYRTITVQAYQLEDMEKEIARLEKQILHIEKMPIIRANCVPNNIPNEFAWNDCWYDAERGRYFTASKSMFMLFGEGKFLECQIEKTATDYAYIMPERFIVITYGYPAVRKTEEKGQRMLFLPTMTEEMLTDEIVCSRIEAYHWFTIHPERFESQVFYETDAPKSYSNKFTTMEREIGRNNNVLFTHDDAVGLADTCSCDFCTAPKPAPKLGTIYPALFSNYDKPLSNINDLDYVSPTQAAAPAAPAE